MASRLRLILWLIVLLTTTALADEARRIRDWAASGYPHLRVEDVRVRGPWAVVDFRHKEVEDGDDHVLQLLLRRESNAWFLIDLHRRGHTLFPVDLAECGAPLQHADFLLGRPATPEQLRQARQHGPFFERLSTHRLTEGLGDGMAKDPWSIMLMRNELYARHGRPFQDPYLRDYYHSRPWYRADPDFREERLNPVERYNIQVLLKEERQSLKALEPVP
jgi:hypothetical protein